jgi:hypothetical protein
MDTRRAKRKRRPKALPVPVHEEQDLNAASRALLGPDTQRRAGERVPEDEASVEGPLEVVGWDERGEPQRFV